MKKCHSVLNKWCLPNFLTFETYKILLTPWISLISGLSSDKKINTTDMPYVSPFFQACPPMRKMRAVPAASVRVGRAVLAVLGEHDAYPPSPDLPTPPRPAAPRGDPSGPSTPCLPSVWTFLMATVSVSLLVEISLCADYAHPLVKRYINTIQIDIHGIVHKICCLQFLQWTQTNRLCSFMLLKCLYLLQK